MPLFRPLFLSLSRSQRLKRLASNFAPVRPVVRRFVAGVILDEAIPAVQALNRQGLLATLDHLGENVTTEAGAQEAADAVLDLLAAIQASGVQSGVSVKLTQLGLDLSRALAAGHLERIVTRAEQAGRFVRIDMESSHYTQVTLDLFQEVRQRHANVGVVIQAYLRRSAADVARLVAMGASVRLVKGAYDEPSDLAFPAKADTDANYIRLMELLFSDEAQATGAFPAIGTHDVALIKWAREHAERRGIPRDRFEFQMLYGIRPGLQRQLADEGYRVRAYVPYGAEWYPYLMRRIAERPANALFLLRSLFRS
jgi:proline dehydrogenase